MKKAAARQWSDQISKLETFSLSLEFFLLVFIRQQFKVQFCGNVFNTDLDLI